MTRNDDQLLTRARNLKQQLQTNQWAWGDWALEVEPPNEDTSKNGGYKRLQELLSRLYDETGDKTPALETVRKYRYVAAAWPIDTRSDKATFSLHKILASSDERFEIIEAVPAGSPEGRWSEAKLRKVLEDREVKKILDKLRDDQAKKIKELEEQAAELDRKLKEANKAIKEADSSYEEELEKEAAKQAQLEVNALFAEMTETLGEDNGSTAKEIVSKLPNIKELAKSRPQVRIRDVAASALRLTMYLKEFGLGPLEANTLREVETDVDKIEQLALLAREAVNEQKAARQ